MTGWSDAIVLLLSAQAPPASAPADAPTIEVEIVYGGSGVPATDAAVFLIDEGAFDSIARSTDFAACFAPEWSVEHGTALPMEERGRVRAPISTRYQRLVAYREGWSGDLYFSSSPTRSEILELWPDGALEVEVIDSTGKPVTGMPVRLMRDEANSTCGHHSPSSMANGVTDSSGVARLERARKRVAQEYDADGVSRYSVAWIELGIACRDPERVLVSPRFSPASRIRLVAPPLARVRLSARGTPDEAWSRAATFEIEVATEQADGPEYSRSRSSWVESETGAPVEVVVGLGTRLQVTAAAGPGGTWCGEAFVTATDASRPAELFVDCHQSLPLVTGRLVDDAGEPLGNAEIRWSSWNADADHFDVRFMDQHLVVERALTRTSPQGRFAIGGPAPSWVKAPIRSEVELRLDGPSREKWSRPAALIRRTVESETDVDLGDVVLRAPEFFATGRVVDHEGSPAVGVLVTAASAEAAMSANCELALTAADGSFAIRAVGDAPALLVETKGARPVLAQRGSKGVEIRLDAPTRPAGERACPGWFIVPDWFDPGWIKIKADYVKIERDSRARTFRIIDPPLPFDLRFVLDAGYPGELLAKVESVDLRDGSDPRIEGVDLRPFLRHARLEVIGPGGAPASRAAVGLFSGTSQLRRVGCSHLWGSSHCDDLGRDSVVTSDRSARLWVGDLGAGVVEVPLDGGEHRITLPRGIVVPITVHGLAGHIPKGVSVALTAKLTATDSTVPKEFLVSLVERIRADARDEEQFELVLPVAGEYDFSIELRKEGGAATSVRLPDFRFRIESEPSMPSLEFQMREDKLERVLRRL